MLATGHILTHITILHDGITRITNNLAQRHDTIHPKPGITIITGILISTRYTLPMNLRTGVARVINR